MRIRGKDWIGKPLGIVTEIKDMIHDQSGTEYTVITAMVGDKYFTFDDQTFELVNSVERKNS